MRGRTPLFPNARPFFLFLLQKWSREWICLLGRRRSAAIRDLLEFLTFKNSRRSQMKTTYLVYKQVNGVRRLVVATPAEWDAILKENRGLPADISTVVSSYP